jgi:hypothetical protein
MGKPGRPRGLSCARKRVKPTLGTETSQYREEKKATAILLVAASERGTAQTIDACIGGVVGLRYGSVRASRRVLESSAIDGDSPVREAPKPLAVSRVPWDTSNPAGIRGDHPPRLNTLL